MNTSRAESYSLTEYQYETLVTLANSGVEGAFTALPELSEDDETSVQKSVSAKLSDLHDLAFLGLVEDLTPKMEEAILSVRLKTGRGFEAFGITEIGTIMFRKQKFKIN